MVRATWGEVLSTPVVEAPNEGYTQTFIGIGSFKVETEAQNGEEIAHAAAHVKYHFRGGGRKHIRHVPAYFMRGEELSHLGFLLRFGVLVVIGKIGLLEVVQSSDAGVAVVDALRRNEVLAGVYGEKYLLVDFGTHTLRYLLGDDGIHDFICLSLKMKTPRKDCLTGCCVNLIMVSFLLG